MPDNLRSPENSLGCPKTGRVGVWPDGDLLLQLGQFGSGVVAFVLALALRLPPWVDFAVIPLTVAIATFVIFRVDDDDERSQRR